MRSITWGDLIAVNQDYEVYYIFLLATSLKMH